MKILSIVTSGLQEESITYNTFEIVKSHPQARKHIYEEVFFRNETDNEKVAEAIANSNADLIIIQTSPFHGECSSQVQMLCEFFGEKKPELLRGRNVTVFDTCMRLFDTVMNNTLEEMIKEAGANYIPALSLGTSDILNKKISKYVISQPKGDYKPEKKGLIGTLLSNDTKELGEKLMKECPEGLQRALDWLRVCERIITGNIPDRAVSVLIVRTSATAPDIKIDGAETICLADYKYVACDSCKLCYVSRMIDKKDKPNGCEDGNDRVCRYDGDDFRKIEEKLRKADVVIFTGELHHGLMRGGLHKRLLDRDVKNGLAPLKVFNQGFGYVVSNPSEHSATQFKEWVVGDCAYQQRHFLGLEDATEENVKKMIDLCKCFFEENCMPQINHYSEKNGRYFADLAVNIKNILGDVYEYFEKEGAYVPVTPDEHSRPTTDPKGI